MVERVVEYCCRWKVMLARSEEKDREPLGRIMGMGDEGWRGMPCFLTKEDEMTLPCAPPSMRIRAAWPLTLHINVRRVVLAWSAVNVETPTPFLRSLRILLLVRTDTGVESGAGARGNAGTRGGRVGGMDRAVRWVVVGVEFMGAGLTGVLVGGNSEGGGGKEAVCRGEGCEDGQGGGASVSGREEGLFKIEN